MLDTLQSIIVAPNYVCNLNLMVKSNDLKMDSTMTCRHLLEIDIVLQGNKLAKLRKRDGG